MAVDEEVKSLSSSKSGLHNSLISYFVFTLVRAVVVAKIVVQILLEEDQLLAGIITFLYATVATNNVTRVCFVHFVGGLIDSLLMLLWYSVYRARSGFMQAVIT